MGDISSITLPNGDVYNFKDVKSRQAIPFGEVDSTSTSTVFTATVPGITELKDGTIVLLKNGVVTSASGFTININGLGAKPVYSNMAAATRETTLFNVNYTLLLIYDEDRVSGGCWINYRGYYSDANSIGYQLRTNSTVMTVTDTARYYKLYFTSANGKQWVPASVNSTNNATSARAVNQRPIDPFGRIVYTSATTNYTSGSNLAATTTWSQYAIVLGYSFNRTGAALVLTTKTPVYIKCAPQTDGSAIIDADTPYVQALPSTADGKIYIFLGIAYDETHVELFVEHPVYWHDGTGIRRWTGSATAAIDIDTALSTTSENPVQNKVITNALPVAATTAPIVDGTAAVGTSTKYAREDHVHPKATYTASEVGLGNVDNVRQYSASNPPPYPVTSVNGNTGAVSLSIPTKTSDLTNDSGFTTNVGTITGVTAGSGLSGGGSSGSVTLNHSNSVTAQTTQALYPVKIDAQGHISAYGTAVTSLPASDVSAWAKAATKPTYTASEVGALPDTTTIPSKTSDLTNDSGFITGMYIGSYGHSTYAEILAAYQANKVVYCRASSNSNPATGSQTRMAFLAYVNNAETPTTFEFQYYRSVSTHTESQQGDQVYIYTLTSAGTWSVVVRSAFSAVAAGTGLSRSYSSGTVTLSVSSPLPSVTSSDNGKVLTVSNGAWAAAASTVSAMTDQEITTAVDNGWGVEPSYTIGYDPNDIEHNHIISISLDGSYGSSAGIVSEANEGDTVTIDTNNHWCIAPTRDDTSESVAYNTVASSLYTLVMPASDITLNVWYDD